MVARGSAEGASWGMNMDELRFSADSDPHVAAPVGPEKDRGDGSCGDPDTGGVRMQNLMAWVPPPSSCCCCCCCCLLSPGSPSTTSSSGAVLLRPEPKKSRRRWAILSWGRRAHAAWLLAAPLASVSACRSLLPLLRPAGWMIPFYSSPSHSHPTSLPLSLPLSLSLSLPYVLVEPVVGVLMVLYVDMRTLWCRHSLIHITSS